MAIKERHRYELTGFRGVDTASTPTDVAAKRATFMRNMINRDGINHKRYGWIHDYNQKNMDTVYSTFEFSVNGKVYKCVHSGTNIYVNDEVVKENVYEGKTFWFYSNSKAYMYGAGNAYVLKEDDTKELVCESVYDTTEAYIPKIYTNIGNTSQGNEIIDTLDSYNLLTHYVRVGLTGTDNTSSEIEYKIPFNFSTSEDKKFFLKVAKILDNGELDYDVYDNISDNVESLYVTSTITKSKVGSVIKKNGTTYTSSIRIDISNQLTTSDVKSMKDKIYCEFSNGMYLKWFGDEETGLDLYLHNRNGDRLDTNSSIINGERHKWVARISRNNNSTLFKYDVSTEILNTSYLVTGNDDLSIETVINDLNVSFYGNFPKKITSSVLYDSANDDKKIIARLYSDKIVFLKKSLSGLDISPISEFDDLIELTLYNSDYKPYYDVSKMRFANLFGADGANDRIFAIGVHQILDKDKQTIDQETQNLVFWSEYSDNSECDEKAFAYFPDNAYASIGATQNAVTGMTCLNDSTLAIFRRKSPNDTDFTALKATYVSLGNLGDTGIPQYELKVTSSSVDMPQTAINGDCFGSMNSDILFASDMGVYAVKISTGTSVERYAVERSDAISNLFKDCDMTTAKAIVYKNKYYLAVKYNSHEKGEDGKEIIEDLVLIADARYKYTQDRQMDDTFSYEWYIWDHCPVQKWIVENDKLGFYDYEGSKCFFVEDNYTDIKYTNIKNITMRFSKNEDGMLVIDTDKSNFEKEGNEYKYFYILNGVKNTSINNMYSLFEYQGLTGLELQGDDITFGYAENERDDNTVTIAYSKITKVVDAIWITPCMDLGASDKLKTLFMLTLGMEHTTSGRFEFGYQTKYQPYSIQNPDRNKLIRSSINAESYGNYEWGFNSLTLGQEFASAYTSKTKLRNFNYIQFIFRSRDDGDLCVNGITMLYKYNTYNKGVR